MSNPKEQTNKGLELPVCYNVGEVCQRTGLSRATVSRALSSGDLEHYRIGSRAVIPAAAVVAWLERHRVARRPALRVA
jgi:excisionase family DNA binding protein